MGHVIASVSKYAAAVSSSCRIPIPEDDGVCEFPERCGKRDKKCRRHDKPILVHGKVVVDAVEEEMQGDTDTIVWQVPTRC